MHRAKRKSRARDILRLAHLLRGDKDTWRDKQRELINEINEISSDE